MKIGLKRPKTSILAQNDKKASKHEKHKKKG